MAADLKRSARQSGLDSLQMEDLMREMEGESRMVERGEGSVVVVALENERREEVILGYFRSVVAAMGGERRGF